MTFKYSFTAHCKLGKYIKIKIEEQFWKAKKLDRKEWILKKKQNKKENRNMKSMKTVMLLMENPGIPRF